MGEGIIYECCRRSNKFSRQHRDIFCKCEYYMAKTRRNRQRHNAMRIETSTHTTFVSA